MGFADLANDTLGAFENALSALTGIGNNGSSYPKDYEYVTNKIDEGDKSWRKSLGYGFRVVRVKDGKSTPARDWSKFLLQINPSELNQEEIFAIEVTPTFSGVTVEHQGTSLKDVSITGTTGISPNRSYGGAYGDTGRPVSASGRSGYTEFHELRNYIRSYVEQKRVDAGDEGELRLVWDNLKDHESLFIEPQRFTMKRSSGKPFSYDYVFNFKSIGVATFEPKSGSWLDILAGVDGAIEDAVGYIDSGTKILQGLAGLIKRTEREIVSAIITPFNSINDGLRAYGSLKAAVNSAPKTFSKLGIQSLIDRATVVQDNTYSYFLGDKIAEYNRIKGIEATSPQHSVVDGELSYEQVKIMNALKKLKQAGRTIVADNKAFEKDAKEKFDAANDLYSNAPFAAYESAQRSLLDQLKKDIELKKKSGDIAGQKKSEEELEEELENLAQAAGRFAAAPINTSKTKSISVTIEAGQTIQSVAAKHLQSADAYREIILLNSLKPPYINPIPIDDDPVRVSGVLRPGDTIQIPVSGSLAAPNGVFLNKEYPITRSLSKAQKNFGVDLRLNNDFDVEIAGNKDAKLVSSVSNVVQAILLKLLYPVGSLKRHLDIGTSLSIGEKLANVSKLSDEIRTSLLAESRIDSVVYVKTSISSGFIDIKLILRLKDLDQPIDLPVKLPLVGV